MVSISGMLLFSRNLPESTNSDSAGMSATLSTFDSLSICLYLDLLLSMDNLMLSISIDMSFSHWSFVYQLMFIRWCIPHKLMFIHWCIPHQLMFIRWCIPHQLMFLTVPCAFFCIHQADNYNVSTSFMYVMCLRIFIIWHSTCIYPLIQLFIIRWLMFLNIHRWLLLLHR